MKIEVEIPEYDRSTGLVYSWEGDFRITVKFHNGELVISANRDGLRSLAQQLLALAQDNVPAGAHYHYDPGTSLEENSAPMVIEKTP